MMRKQLIVIGVILLFSLPIAAQEIDLENIDPSEQIKPAEDLMRADNTYTEITMDIVTPDWKRQLSMRNWGDRLGKRSFIQILSPARDENTTFLRLDRQLWMYLPRAERTIKVPPSMMMQSWMGSDFSNDDLVQESSYVTDYTHEFKGMEEVEGLQCYVIILVPKPEAPITWGKVEIAVSSDPFVPVRYQFFNRRMEMRKQMIMSEIKRFGSRELPTVWTMTTADKEGHQTIIRVNKMEFNLDLPERVFTRQYLRNPR
jgi:outer membrane lipoprotein-sorting protein